MMGDIKGMFLHVKVTALWTTEDNCDNYSPGVLSAVKYNFYVDHCISSPDEASAICLVIRRLLSDEMGYKQ